MRFKSVSTLVWGLLLLELFTTVGRAFSGEPPSNSPYLLVLGIAQDGGYPQAGCQKSCCQRVYRGEETERYVASLAIVDPRTGRRWIVEATPDFPEQLRWLDQVAPAETSPGLAGIFLTHAHVGHYTGLMHLGREIMGARSVPVYAMPRLMAFLRQNGPWSLLVKLQNIELRPMQAQKPIQLANDLVVMPFRVPHRDEFSETVGFWIRGPNRRVLFIPDIDKWERWDTPIETWLSRVDVALLDGTFYADGEIPGRNMSEIPHPFIVESMRRFAALPVSEKRKIRFIHLNHTNPALQPDSEARKSIKRAGFSVARQGERFDL